jgi:arginine N-succinyltransferase
MLEAEGFTFDRYIDIFDGGPTVTAPTDAIRTVRESETDKVAAIGEGGSQRVLIAAGRLNDFRACCATVKKGTDGLTLDRDTAELLEVEVGDEVLTVGRDGAH